MNVGNGAVPTGVRGAPELELRQVRHLYQVRSRAFGGRKQVIHALDGVSFRLEGGSTLGVVGESGCGKTTLGRVIVRLLTPTEGEVRFEGLDIARLERKRWRALRPRIQFVFQDTQSSLDPRMTIESILSEPIRINRPAHGAEIYGRVLALVEQVGLIPQHLQRYPHELSGGQRQRVVIARALATEPELIVLDEPTSALDVSVQAQILNLLKDLQSELSLTYIFISHDLAIVRAMSDRIAVMYLGEIVEEGLAEEVFRNPLHPYTRLLFASILRPDPRLRRTRLVHSGDIAPPDAPPPGCRFHPRCPRGQQACIDVAPELVERAPAHQVACHFPHAVRPRGLSVHGRSQREERC